MARRLPFGVVPETPGPGQESVWDYPRPPLIERRDADIRLTLGGVLVCHADYAYLIKETSHPPTYYLPRAAWREGSLRRAAGSSFCEWKGAASYLDVVALDDSGAEVGLAAGAAWFYPTPVAAYAQLRDHISVYPAPFDEVTVDGEKVVPQVGGFYGGWVTSDVVGPFKGEPGSRSW